MSTHDELERSTDPLIAAPLRPTAAPSPASQPATPPTPAVSGAAFDGRTGGGPSRLRIGLVGGAAVALAVGAVATSLAAQPSPSTDAGAPSTRSGWIAPAVTDPRVGGEVETFDHGRFGARGGFGEITITAISGSSVTLETADGWTRTITITDAIELTKGGQDIDLSDLAVGDQVRLGQSRDDDGAFTVEALAVVVPSVAGTVSEVTDGSFKVTTRDGSVWTIAIDDDTVYQLGAVDGSKSDLTNGDIVRVQGESTGDNTLQALQVRIAVERTVGRVTATTDTTITLQTRGNDTVTVHVDGDTVYRITGDDAATLDDITVDMLVGVQGVTRDDGSIDADAVTGGKLDGGRGFERGFGGPGGPIRGSGDHGPWAEDDVPADPVPSPTTGS